MELTVQELVKIEAKRQKMTMDELAARACIEKRTLFRRLADPGSLRMSDLRALGRALGWTPTKMTAVLAAAIK